MNKKMKMFIICAVFALISSCKNYASSKDLKNLEQNVEGKVKGFLEAKKEELSGGLKKFGGEVSSKVEEELMPADAPRGQLQEQVAQGVNENLKLKEELEKKIKELKEKINNSDPKKTSLKTYCEYEKEVKELTEKLKDKLKGKEEDELESLRKALSEKIEKRKKELEDLQNKFKGFKEQVANATGVTTGDQVKTQGQVGLQALKCAKDLGLNVSYSNNTGTDSNELANKIIDDTLKQIEEELQNIGEAAVEEKKE
ncbi:hypothetical protein [Borreliella bavariensis]|uniref:hypothetical protein n=1 Tax=Borreliella bavariensis TaxID=664662 RepID=UPI001C03D5BB|nr:hypothetical protein [Borreliella bavariensis]